MGQITFNPRCPDCNVGVGEAHSECCDVARCLKCGDQYISCLCEGGAGDIWTGLSPCTLEAAQKGLWCRWGENGWETCNHDDEGAGPDLNRFYELGYNVIQKKKIYPRVTHEQARETEDFAKLIKPHIHENICGALGPVICLKGWDEVMIITRLLKDYQRLLSALEARTIEAEGLLKVSMNYNKEIKDLKAQLEAKDKEIFEYEHGRLIVGMKDGRFWFKTGKVAWLLTPEEMKIIETEIIKEKDKEIARLTSEGGEKERND